MCKNGVASNPAPAVPFRIFLRVTIFIIIDPSLTSQQPRLGGIKTKRDALTLPHTVSDATILGLNSQTQATLYFHEIARELPDVDETDDRSGNCTQFAGERNKREALRAHH